jgi:peptide-methionine (S)-S-oxide reductase
MGDNPTCQQVTAGGTGHFEAVQIRYDPATVSRARLRDLFFRSMVRALWGEAAPFAGK